ncbi:hypothetical protein [Paraburkholderia sp. J11-2]|uniref:hypothetical protein n=1 Tax=Paraburkholderia sp. J11-2 TaxID=2805431 RepID=UPI002AB6DD16|nr:hypothetical protein [Paraburkholderia sp. J11-2]
MTYFNLKCAACDKTQLMEGQEPSLGVHIMTACEVAGWGYVTDYQRVLVVCDDECGQAMLTKKGTIRKRPPTRFVKEVRQ